MGLLQMFRRKPEIETREALADFLDSHAAFLTQKAIFEYSRARAGSNWQHLFKEKAFVAAIESSRWNSFPIALGNVTEMIDAVLRDDERGRTPEAHEALIDVAKTVLERYPVPEGEPADFWAVKRDWLEARLRPLRLAPPHPFKHIPDATFDQFFDLLPIHKELRGHDRMLVHNHLRMNLASIYETNRRRLRPERLVSVLLDQA
ncbi:MAG: hypothetical protein H6883_02870 [Rhodobiaceae bacterium]|nr:hypothetical protein [Rhodobiaceae bacterium]MCC0055060.1 hypothetical protein [Rhodobiaceae bacterium]